MGMNLGLLYLNEGSNKAIQFRHIYIYIVCAEGLSAIIRRPEEVGLLHGCSIAKGAPKISHLLFVDDCYFYLRATG